MSALRPVSPAQRGHLDLKGLAALASEQQGVLSRAQLLASGVSDSAISRWAATGRLHRVHPGVYTLGHAALSLDGRLIAALMYGGDEAVFSHTTAAWLWSLIEAEPKRIHLTVPGRRRSLPQVRIHRAGEVAPCECRGLPVTPVARTLLDLAGMLSFGDLRRALAEADQQGLLDPRELGAVLGSGRRGSGALRGALRTHLPELADTLSVLEERFLELCESSGLPLPQINAKVDRMRVDAVWWNVKLAVELDGVAFHDGAANVKRDRSRELALRNMGFRVVRYSWEQITRSPGRVVADLRRLFAG